MIYQVVLNIFFIILTVTTYNYTQQNSITSNYAPNWVSISNEYISVFVDKKTGRYIVFDNNRPYTQDPININTSNQNFSEISPIDIEKINLSPMLGDKLGAFNIATIMIDDTPIVFGSQNGRWNSLPIVNSNNIIYSWHIGGIDIVQTVTIVTNSETLFPDAVQITYDAFNKNNNNSRTLATRLILDTTYSDGQQVPYVLPNNRGLSIEYNLTENQFPDYWMTTDIEGQISSGSLKGFLRDISLTKPSKIYFTTLQKSLSDIWNYNYTYNKSISKQNNAILLYFNPQKIIPNGSIRLASTTIAIPSLINSFQNNGLEAKISTFTSKQTSPLTVDLWLKNNTNIIFDQVVINIKTPSGIELYDNTTTNLYNIGMGNLYPVSWTIDAVNENVEDTYNIEIDIQGYRNSVLESKFIVPIAVSFDKNIKSNNYEALMSTIHTASNIVKQQTLPINKIKQNKITNFNQNDTTGDDLSTLSQIYQYLQKSSTPMNSQIINLIETEQQLIQEINDLQKDLEIVNEQYYILLGIYERMYNKNSTYPREQIYIQELLNNIEYINSKLESQKQMISNINID